MFKRILVILVTVFSFAMADPIDIPDEYRIYVKAIDEEFHLVALSNGLICQVTPQGFWLEKNLKVGDEVYLDLSLSIIERKNSIEEEIKPELALRNDNTGKEIYVWITEASKKNGLTYVSDTVRTIQPAGWFSQAVNQTIIELSNGSKWVSSQGPTFSKGEHVLPTYDTSSHGWQLINLDKAEIKKASEIVGIVETYLRFGGDCSFILNSWLFVTPFKEDSNVP